jgi:hypothetical protein
MEHETMGQTGAGLVRQPGRRGGCSCCGFTMLGLVAMPVLAVVLAFVAL